MNWKTQDVQSQGRVSLNKNRLDFHGLSKRIKLSVKAVRIVKLSQIKIEADAEMNQ
ncbi:MAG: hypothetical protein V4727_12800 [Verrucomicrobiota bacterium]